MKTNSQSKVFWTIIAIFMSFTALFLSNISQSKNLMNVVFDLEDHVTTPLELTGDPVNANIFQRRVSLKKDTSYIFTGTVTASPEVRLDFVGPDYDASEQEYVIAGTNVRFEHLLNSYDPPMEDTYFRIFFRHENTVIVDSVVVYEESVKNRIVYYFALVLLAGALALLMKLYYKTLFFYFLLVSIIVFLVYLPQKYPKMGQGGDNKWYIPSVLSMIIENNTDISEYPSRIAEVNLSGTLDIHGTKYMNLAYGTSLINYPLSLITRNFYSCDPYAERTKLKCGEQIADMNAKIFAAMSVGLLFLTVFLLTSSVTQSAILSFVFAFASPHFTYHAGGLWAHNISVFFMTFTLFLLLNKKHSYTSAIPLAMSYVTRPTMAVSVLLVSGYYFIKERKYFIKFASLGGFIALMFFAYNYITFQKFFPPYYAGGRLSFDLFLDATLGLLFSPNRGLFIFFPVAIFSVIGMYYSFKKNGQALFKMLSLALVGHFVINATFPHWWGGTVYGPRPVAEFIPYFILLLIPVWHLIKQKKSLQIIFTIFVIWSVFVQYRGLTSQGSWVDWPFTPISVDFAPDRIWDWKDMQIFRGFPD